MKNLQFRDQRLSIGASLGLALLLCVSACSKEEAAQPTPQQAKTKAVSEDVGTPPTTTTTEVKDNTMNTAEATTTYSEPTEIGIDTSKKYVATITTAKGVVTCELDANAAPYGVTNFKQLADGGFYNGLTFHRVEPGFVVQGGDPDGTGMGGPGYTVRAEIGLEHTKGALAWARTGDQVNPERKSSGSQFYITLEATPFLDNQYSVFGYVTEGMDVVAQIARGEVIESVVVTEQ